MVGAFASLALSHGFPFEDLKKVDRSIISRDLRKVLSSLGPTFIKLGQTLATRPDVVGEVLARELENLQVEILVCLFSDLSGLAQKAGFLFQLVCMLV